MDTEIKNFSVASLVVVLGFPPMILYQLNKHILFRSLDSLHFIFFQLVFFFAYHHLLGIPSLSTAIINYFSRKTLKQSNNNHNTRSIKKSSKQTSSKQTSNNKDGPTYSRQISSAQNSSTQNSTFDPVRNSHMGASKHKYSKMTAKLLETFLKFVDEKNDSSWSLIYEDKDTDIKVYQNSQVSDCCYKVTGTMENTPQTTFDLLADVRRRSEWDHMTDEAGIVEVIDESTKIQYIKMKSVFPTSARDVVTIGYTTQLDDARMIMVNKSIEHKLCPEKPGVVRLEAGCAGVVVVPIKDQPNKCFVTQIADANPKGWIPKSVITLVSTRDMPASVKRLNKLLAKMPRQSVSKVLSHTPFIPKVPTRSSSSNSLSSSLSPPLRYHRKISSFNDLHSYLSEEFLSNEKEFINNDRSINKRDPSNISFWKTFLQTILLFGGNSKKGNSSSTGRFIFTAFAYSLVLIAGIKKLRNKNIF